MGKRRGNIYHGDYSPPYGSPRYTNPYPSGNFKDRYPPSYMPPLPHSYDDYCQQQAQKEAMENYTIFTIDNKTGKWTYLTGAAKGTSHLDATSRYYGNRVAPSHVICFPTVAGRRLRPPVTPGWVEETL